MEYLAQYLQQFFGDPTIFRIAFTSLVAMAIFLFGLGVLFLASTVFDPLRRRLRLVQAGGGSQLQQQSYTGQLTSALEPLAGLTMPRKDWERNKASQRLVHAGIRNANALTGFYAIKTILIILLPGTVLLVATIFPHFTTRQVAFALLLTVFLAVTLPDAVLENLARKRIRKLRHGFPDALDLLVVCTEAGLGLNLAIERVSQEIEDNHPELSQELQLVNAQIRAGVQREDALRDLAQRTGLEDIRGLVGLLTQSMRLGTGVADTLRIYSEEFRDKRMQRAEELAAKIGTKMIFPLVICLFPGFFVVILGPAILRILATFGRLS
jgi:tight adherence protein C